jgi:hypothetical protein
MLTSSPSNTQLLFETYSKGIDEGLFELQDFGVHCCATVLMGPWLLQPLLMEILWAWEDENGTAGATSET